MPTFLYAMPDLGCPRESASMPRVVDLASSALAVPASGWGGQDGYPEPKEDGYPLDEGRLRSRGSLRSLGTAKPPIQPGA